MSAREPGKSRACLRLGRVVLALIVALPLVNGTARAQPAAIEVKLTASDAAPEDHFGASVDIDDDTVVVGAKGHTGSVYVFQRDAGGADNWGEVKKLTASDGAASDFFGSSVAISADTVIVGAFGDAGTLSGSAYVFQRDAGGVGNWGEVKKLTASDAAAGDYFGWSVAISGDTVIVGAHQDDHLAGGNNSGSAYVFRRDVGGVDNWGEVKKLTAFDAGVDDLFGRSVTISGDTAIVGAERDKDAGNDSGSAYVFQRDAGGAGNWGLVVKLTASDAATKDRFGRWVDINGDTAVVGAYFAGGSGSAYVFQRDVGGADNWGEVEKLTASDAALGDRFGVSVDINGDTVIVGAYFTDGSSGSAYVFRRDAGGVDNWGEVKKLNASDTAAEDSFGSSVAISGDTAIVGAGGNDDAGNMSGSAYVYLELNCGNGVADAGEQCDDGNTADGDCCSSSCRYEENGTACDDGNPCVLGDQCAAGVCVGLFDRDCSHLNAQCLVGQCNEGSGDCEAVAEVDPIVWTARRPV